MTALLTAENVAVYAKERLVEPASLALHARRPLTLLGETGSGKSLLAQAIMGTLPQGLRAEGSITIAGQHLPLEGQRRHRSLWGRTMSVLPQEPWLALDPTMRALEQVAEGHVVRGLDKTQARLRAQADLDNLSLSAAGGKLPSQLSGGMAQRVAFAAARAGGARILVADEPTKGLDVTRRDDVMALLMREVEEGGGLLTITHDLELARRIGGDLAVMLDGAIIEQGRTEDVLGNPQHAYTRRLIAAAPSNWAERASEPAAGDPVLVAEGLSKTRGGQLLFDGQSLTVRPGEIIGITGPSGCGKSTFGDILLGLLQPDEGSVRHGENLPSIKFQKLYQDPPSAFPQRITLRRAILDLVKRHDLDEERIEPLMAQLRLSPRLLDRRPTEVSGGELQRIALLRVLLLQPVFLFADEPTSRLDLITQQEMVDLLVGLAREQGCAVLIVSHDAELIGKVSDRVLSLEGARRPHEESQAKRKPAL